MDEYVTVGATVLDPYSNEIYYLIEQSEYYKRNFANIHSDSVESFSFNDFIATK